VEVTQFVDIYSCYDALRECTVQCVCLYYY